MSDAALTRGSLLRYGALGLPLAFAGLPVYVHVPKFYADALHIDLALLGGILLFIRLFDAILDPIIGMLSDKFCHRRHAIMAASVPMLTLGYLLLFNPAAWAEHHVMLWLLMCLALVYVSFSTLMINYYAAGINMAQSYNDHTRVATFREGSMLIGVLLASVLPPVLLQHYPLREAYSYFSFLLVPLVLVCAFITLRNLRVTQSAASAPSFWHLLKNKYVRWVLFIAFCNSIPTAITSTLFMFFTADVLHAADQSGLMLVVYFLSAAAGMPFWAHLSARAGKKKSLLCAMVVAIVCFIWAWGLGAGDSTAFFIICILSGITLGADSALLPSMLADTLESSREASATGFGLWNLTSKLTMAFAAGMALPLLETGGYHPDMANNAAALHQLSLCYALLPCLFKAIAVAMLHFSPLDQRNPS